MVSSNNNCRICFFEPENGHALTCPKYVEPKDPFPSQGESWEKEFNEKFNFTEFFGKNSRSEKAVKDFIKTAILKAWEEGKNMKGSSWREGYERGLEEGKQNEFKRWMQSSDFYTEAFEAGRSSLRREVGEKIKRYFEGLILIPDPQATCESLIEFLSTKEGEKNHE